MIKREKEPVMDLYWWPEGAKEQTDLETSYAIIDDLFSWYTLEDLKACLWRWLKTALENETQQAYAEARPRNLIFLYEQICDLVAAAYFLAKEKEEGKTENIPADGAH